MRFFLGLVTLTVALTVVICIKKSERKPQEVSSINQPDSSKSKHSIIHKKKPILLPKISTTSSKSTKKSSKVCSKKKNLFLKKERSKLRKLLKEKTILSNKIQSNKIVIKIKKISGHLKKCKTKKKNSKNRLKTKPPLESNNTFEITTAVNIMDVNWIRKEDKLDEKVIIKLEQHGNDFKTQGTYNTIIEDNKVDVNRNSRQNTENLKFKPNINSFEQNNQKVSTPKSEQNTSIIGENRRNEFEIENPINYANLLMIKTTTLPPFKNISLNKIIKEFNAIQNEIQEILPHKANFYKTKLTINKNIPLNRCSLKRGGCQHKCHPFGVLQCSCMSGFKLINRKKCIDINECQFNNGNCKTYCHNTPGSYYCSCKKGFRLSDNQKDCIDINECLLRNRHGPCQDTCINTIGSYKCSCSGLNGTKLSEDKHSCLDIDECLNNKSGCSHYCINTLGRAYCMCPEGMVLGLDWKRCIDVDECQDEEVQKHCKYGCVNTIGSYRCANSYELQSDQMVPDLVVCPKMLPPKLGFLECTREKSLKINLRSKSGRKRVTNRPGTFCQLRCPEDFKVEGIFKITCGYDGHWFGERSGKCVKI